jgi:hypothetical protein
MEKNAAFFDKNPYLLSAVEVRPTHPQLQSKNRLFLFESIDPHQSLASTLLFNSRKLLCASPLSDIFLASVSRYRRLSY